MTCDKIKNYLREHFGLPEGNIPPEIKAHLDSCSDCRDYHNSLYQLEAQLQPLGDITMTGEESSHLQNRLATAMKENNMAVPAKRVFAWRLATIAVMVFVMVMVFNNRQTQTPSSYDDLEQLSLSNVNVDQIDSLFADDNLLPVLLEPATATYVVAQVPPGQADNLLENVSKEELEWLASNFKMEI